MSYKKGTQLGHALYTVGLLLAIGGVCFILPAVQGTLSRSLKWLGANIFTVGMYFNILGSKINAMVDEMRDYAPDQKYGWQERLTLYGPLVLLLLDLALSGIAIKFWGLGFETFQGFVTAGVVIAVVFLFNSDAIIYTFRRRKMGTTG